MIESLHSPHVARVKALIGSKGARERNENGLFVAEGMQCIREALTSQHGPHIETLYLTSFGESKISADGLDISDVKAVEVSDAVMQAMTTTVTPQGVLALCSLPRPGIKDLLKIAPQRIAYLSQIQDPGNAGTILRTADAMGFGAIVTSPESVDMYSPKVVRSTAGSLWHVPLFEGIEISELISHFPNSQFIALSAHGTITISEIDKSAPIVAIFGNEARGLDHDLIGGVKEVQIPMAGRAESLNLSAAASIVMYELTR